MFHNELFMSIDNIQLRKKDISPLMHMEMSEVVFFTHRTFIVSLTDLVKMSEHEVLIGHNRKQSPTDYTLLDISSENTRIYDANCGASV